VIESLIGMISAVTAMTPPANEPIPPFIQGPIDRAVDRISAVVAPGDTRCCPRQPRLLGWAYDGHRRLQLPGLQRHG
jgi:hypothetical protein